jgi:NAD-dependent deacetylase
MKNNNKIVTDQNKIVALTGAGISAPSGIPTFEMQPHAKEFLTHERFTNNPKEFWDFYKELTLPILLAEPNFAHKLLAEHKIPVITQNIDLLHERAGSLPVVHLHGEYCWGTCIYCKKVHYIAGPDAPTHCKVCGDWIKPGVTLYGEMLPSGAFERAVEIIEGAKTLLVIGTRLLVSPANQLVPMAINQGTKIIELNTFIKLQSLKNILDSLA